MTFFRRAVLSIATTSLLASSAFAEATPFGDLNQAQVVDVMRQRALDTAAGRAAALATARDMQARAPAMVPSRFGSAALGTDKGPSFYIYAADSTVVGNWADNTFRASALQKIMDDFYGRPGVPASQIILVYTTFDIARGLGAFYVPLANDIKGIGYKHQQGGSGQEIFGLPPPYTASGFVMMNDYQSYGSGTGRQGFEHYLTSMQEIGHRWGAQMQIAVAGKEKIMLGRDESHWSFYLDTGGSPMEGNAWVDNQNGTFTTRTLSLWFAGQPPPYSQLDLYAMGLMGSAEVQPWFVIEPAAGSAFPAACGPVFNCSGSDRTVTGTRRDIALSDVIASEGVRVPATSPADLHISVLLVVPMAQLPVSASTKSAVETLVQQVKTFYAMATRGRGNIVFDSTVALPPLKGLGAPCLSSAECDPAVSDQCSRSDAGDQARCVRNCTASCAAGYCCAGALGNSMACFEGGSAACPDTMPPMKQGLGERCGDASECQSDLCLEQPGEPGYLFCSADCSASMPCGGAAGQFTCADAGGGRSVCIYAGTPPGGLGTACTAGDGCASGMCLPLAGGSQCSTLCTDTMPCPGGFDCIPTAGVEKVCQKQAPPPGGGDGGCQTSGSSGRAGTLAGVMMLLAALVLVSRRRS